MGNLVLQLTWKECPKCNKMAEAIIEGEVNSRNKFKDETVKVIGWKCSCCGFKKYAKKN